MGAKDVGAWERGSGPSNGLVGMRIAPDCSDQSGDHPADAVDERGDGLDFVFGHVFKARSDQHLRFKLTQRTARDGQMVRKIGTVESAVTLGDVGGYCAAPDLLSEAVLLKGPGSAESDDN